MEQVLLVIHVLIATALIGMVLIQRSDTDGFGLGSGSGMNLLSGRGAANLLTRTTAILAALFIANSLLLSILAARHSGTSIVDQIGDSSVPVVTRDKDTGATMPGLNRDAAGDTDKAAKDAVEEKKAPSVPTE